MEPFHRRRILRATVLLVCLAMLSTACTAGDDNGGDGGHDDGFGPTEGSACPDLVVVECQDQVATADFGLLGTGLSLNYSSDRVPGRKVAPRWDARRVGFGGWTLAGHDVYDPDKHLLFAGDGDVRAVEATAGAHDRLLVPSADGVEVSEFDGDGRHLRTLDALTGVVLRAFGYDGDDRLVKITDRQGAVTKVDRAANGTLKGVVGPQGARTELRLGPDGFLAGASDPTKRVDLGYAKQGLLTSFTDAAGQTTTFAYDKSGRLRERTDAGGVKTVYATKTEGKRRVVTATLPSSRSTTWSFEALGGGRSRRTLRGPDGARTVETIDGRQRTVVLPDRTRLVTRLAPDPRWDGRSLRITAATVSTPGGRSVTVEQPSKVVLIDADDPLSVRSSTSSVRSGTSTSTSRWDARSRSLSLVDAEGSKAVVRIDARGNPVSLSGPGKATENRSYDRRGRLVAVVQGDRRTKVAYRDETGEAEITDPLGQRWMIGADSRGAVSSTVRPDGRRVTIERSPAGRPIAVNVDGRQVQTLGWSPDGKLVAAGPGGADTEVDTASLDGDGRTARIRRGDGRTLTAKYDDTGLSSIALTEGELTFGRDGSGKVVSSTSPSGAKLATTSDGFVVEGERLTGSASGKVGWKFDDEMRVSALDVAGVTVGFDRDRAGRLVKAGDLVIKRDPDTGRPVATTAGEVTSRRSYDAFGALDAESFSSGGTGLFATTIERDALGRITQVTEKGGRTSGTTAYAYDSAGRLTGAKSGGTGWTYAYDDHDNRIRATSPDGAAVGAEYDSLDRLVRLGDRRYSWRDDGTLESVTSPAGTTTVDFDEFGQLTGATAADGTEVGYVTDSRGRRVGRTEDGDAVQGFLYGDDLNVVAETGPDGEVVRRFVHTATGAPSLIVTEDATYRVITDHTGSPRRVVDTANGRVIQEIDYDPFGRIVRDTKPGFQPFGFGGGLLDPATGFVHLGARDYDPGAGRWISRDPSYLAGGQINAYTFADDDPVNRIDPTGLQAQPPDGDAEGYPGDGVVPPTYTIGGDRFGLLGGPDKNPELTKEIGEGLLQPAEMGLKALGQNFEGAAGALGKVSIGLGAKDIVEALLKDDRTPLEGLEAAAKTFATAAEVTVLLGGPVLLPLALFFAVIAAGLALALLKFRIQEAHDGRSSGDPHLLTIDGLQYDFQAVGEFVAIRSDSGDFEVQLRQQPPPADTARSVSFNTALAANVGGDRVTLDTEPGSLRVNGRPFDLVGPADLPKGGKIIPQPDGGVLLLHPDGETGVLVEHFGYFLDVSVALAEGRLGHVHGLYGDGDGDPENDVVTRDGKTVDPEPGDHTAALYAEFGASWRVSQDESLFDYEPGTDTVTFTDTTFPDAQATVESLGDQQRVKAARVCKAAGVKLQPALDNCILDVGTTGDPSFAASAVRTQMTDRRADTGEKEQKASDADALTLGKKVTSKLARKGQRHRHRFTARSGEAVFLKADSTDGTCATGIAIDVVAPSGAEVLHSGACREARRIVLTEDGPYQVVVTARSATGGYSLTLVKSTPDQRFEIEAGEVVGPGRPEAGAGRIDRPGAQDIYVVDAAPGQKLVYKGRPGACELSVRPFDSEGNSLQGLGFVCGELAFTAPTDGQVELRVGPIDETVGNYTFVVEPA